MKKKKQEDKPIIDTIINTTALALTAAGTQWIISSKDFTGFVLIMFGAALEYFKYWARSKDLW